VPLRITQKDGKVAALVCQRTEPGEYDSSGRRKPRVVPDSEFSIEADTVISAIGQTTSVPFLKAGDNIEAAKNGTIVADKVTLATGRTGVFAAGDDVLGPATVVEALGSGERAAISIDRYLRGLDLKKDRFLEKKTPVDIPWDEANLESGARQEMPALAAGERTESFVETNLGYSKETAIKEARRCLRCDLRR